MNGLEALENIAITFDEGGYEPTTLGAKSGHFIEVFRVEFNIIEQDLERLEKLEKAIKILKLCNVDIERLLIHKNAKQYNKGVYYEFCLDEKEFKLLREVLENE